MAFAGVSVIADGKLLEGSTAPAVDAGAASGYHLLVVEGHSRMRAYVASRFFIVGGHRWCIVCYPDGFFPDNAGFISLHLLHDSPEPVKAQFEFSFVNETEKQEPPRIHASTKMFKFDGDLVVQGYDRFVKRDVLLKSRHLKDDCFTIRCDVVVAQEDVTCPCIEVPPSEMKQNFTDLLMGGEGTDVVFQVGGEAFNAHRCVLAARSAVFKALLFGSMKESSTSTTTPIQIDDMDATVFKALLGFIYGDFLPALDAEDDGVELFEHLLVAADRYDLRRLRAMCEKKLSEHISVTTATTFLELAEQHGCHLLKEACFEFLCCPANLRAVVTSDGFEHLCRSCPFVMKDVILDMLEDLK